MLGLSLAGLPVDRLEQLQLLAGLNAIVDGRLIMPWHPTFKATPQQQRARYTLDLLHHGDWLTRMPSWTLQWDDPYRKQIAELAKQVNQVQDDAQRQILLKQYNELIIKQENHRLQAIRELGDTVIDPAVIDLESDYPGMASWTLPPAEQVAYQKQLAVYKSKLAPLIGVMPDGDMSVVRYGNTMGQILSTRGRTAMLNLQFFSPAAGLPALIRWLESEGGRDFEYVLMPSIQ